ncbi:hypothetical protein OIU77_021733 [Salix suchowensis]|uniref:Uncharacterized protein n=1 Tax=Salix suchowensis TaxID=1278906 RepID=A0ABQ9CAV5_9ROSI|nr:hypothetical protein OIU78_000425 [Salix suchowensis]KAJ6396766.1 hypothetical protein OIU77_021733 [Salix suchowensis]
MATVSSESLPETKAAASITDSETAPKPQAIYRCKRCRRIVASEENIVPHERGKGEQCFKWNKKSVDSCKNQEPPECSSIFVEPMKWMQTGKYMLQISVLFLFCNNVYVPFKNASSDFEIASTRRFCGGETSVHGLQSALGFLQLGRHAMQLWNVDQSCVSTSQK